MTENLYRLIRAGLPVVRVGRPWRFRKKDKQAPGFPPPAEA